MSGPFKEHARDPIVDQYLNRDRGDDGPPGPIESGGLIALPGSVAMMLDLRFKNGCREAIPYGYITRVRHDPGTGITVTTNERTVGITGRLLEPVYNAVITHTALAIIESKTGFDDPKDDSPFVEAIHVLENAPPAAPQPPEE